MCSDLLPALQLCCFQEVPELSQELVASDLGAPSPPAKSCHTAVQHLVDHTWGRRSNLLFVPWSRPRCSGQDGNCSGTWGFAPTVTFSTSCRGRRLQTSSLHEATYGLEVWCGPDRSGYQAALQREKDICILSLRCMRCSALGALFLIFHNIQREDISASLWQLLLSNDTTQLTGLSCRF